MKKFFIAIAAIATAAACSQNETISLDNGEAISFGNAFVENSTRADVATDPSLNATTFTEFKVWGTVGGVPIYTNNTVKGTVGADKIWSCPEVKQYWIADAQYKFAALANAGTVTLGEDKLPAKTTFDATNANVDLLYAEPVSRTGIASGNAPVAFTFNHLLSKVKFTVVNDSKEAAEYSFKVNGITITGNQTGDVTLATKVWDNLSNSGAYNVAEITVDKNTADAGQECERELLLIPGEFAIAFNVDIYNGTTKLGSQSYPIAPATYNYTLAAGCSYNFQINVAVGEEIKFSVENDPSWTNQEPGINVQ